MRASLVVEEKRGKRNFPSGVGFVAAPASHVSPVYSQLRFTAFSILLCPAALIEPWMRKRRRDRRASDGT